MLKNKTQLIKYPLQDNHIKLHKEMLTVKAWVKICLAKQENKEIREAESIFTVKIVFMGKIIKQKNIFQEITYFLQVHSFFTPHLFRKFTRLIISSNENQDAIIFKFTSILDISRFAWHMGSKELRA